MTAAPVLVLRPQPGADETVRALAARGIAALARPVLGIEPLPETPALRALVQRLDEFDVVVFVSPAAVRHGMKWMDEHWPQYPARIAWLAVGERTRRALAAWDLDALAPADPRTEGLVELEPLAAPGVERVLIVRGEGGREALAETLSARGLRVEHLVVHARRPLAVALPAPDEIAAAVATSAEVVDAFVATGGGAFVERPLLVPSERVADHARGVGFQRVRIMAGAGAAETLEALAALGITGPPGQGGEQ